jgi:8-oxo-dGTP pyrophosphatase MutT (NUDIX family)
MKEEKKKARSAGFIIVRQRDGSWEVLGLRVWGKIDIPKGHLESGESDLDAARRECFEEAGINVSKKDMRWGTIHFTAERPQKDVVIFLASTDQKPEIKPNPETKQYEHDGYRWMSWDDLRRFSYPYLRSAIDWAQSTVERNG